VDSDELIKSLELKLSGTYSGYRGYFVSRTVHNTWPFRDAV